MAKRVIIGYQLTNAKHELPKGLFSFQIFRDKGNAYKYARQHESELPNGCFMQIIWSDCIGNPTYID